MKEVLELPACTVHLNRRRAVFADREEKLTARDVEVLRYLAARQGGLVTREELERDVWEMAPSVRSNAVPVAIRRIRKRIERDPADPEALLTDYGQGWRLHEVSEPAVAPRAPELFGRDALLARLRRPTRLRTLVGPGGIGKTSIARSLGADVFIDLSTCTDARDCLDALGRALPELALAEEVEERVAQRLARSSLVVIDNAEQVLHTVRSWATSWEVPLVVTSRIRLGVPGEEVVNVEPLSLEAAAALFQQRYRDAGGHETLETSEIEPVVEALDRLPLAIELVAPRARILPLPRLHAHLQRGLDAIPAGQGRPERHTTMRACLRWSIGELEPRTLHVLHAAAQFADRFDLDGLEAVAGTDAFAALDALLDRSLIVQRRPGVFHLLRLVRTFARESAPDELQERYLGYVLQALERLGGARADVPERDRWVPDLRRVVQLGTPAQVEVAAQAVLRSLKQAGHPALALHTLEQAEARLGTLPAELALDRVGVLTAVDPVSAASLLRGIQVDDAELQLLWLVRAHYLHRHGVMESPSTEAFTSLLAQVAEPDPRVLASFAMHLVRAGEHEEARRQADRAVQIARRQPSERLLIGTLLYRDAVLTAVGDRREGEARLREILGIAERNRFKRGVVAVRHNLARVLAVRDREAADAAFAEAAAGYAALGQPRESMLATHNRLLNLWFAGRPDEARQLLPEAPPAQLQRSQQAFAEALQATLRWTLGLLDQATALARIEALDGASNARIDAIAELCRHLLGAPRGQVEHVLEGVPGPPYDEILSGLLGLVRERDRSGV